MMTQQRKVYLTKSLKLLVSKALIMKRIGLGVQNETVLENKINAPFMKREI